MNEETNVLTLPKEITEEIFFNEESRRIREAFAGKSDEENLVYLRRQLQYMKTLVTRLELPWDRYIPILFRAFTFYMRHPDSQVNGMKNIQLSTQLIECIMFLSQNGRLINASADFFDRQIHDLDTLMTDKEVTAEE